MKQKSSLLSMSGIKFFDPQQFGAKSSNISSSDSDFEASVSDGEQNASPSVQRKILQELQTSVRGWAQLNTRS